MALQIKLNESVGNEKIKRIDEGMFELFGSAAIQFGFGLNMSSGLTGHIRIVDGEGFIYKTEADRNNKVNGVSELDLIGTSFLYFDDGYKKIYFEREYLRVFNGSSKTKIDLREFSFSKSNALTLNFGESEIVGNFKVFENSAKRLYSLTANNSKFSEDIADFASFVNVEVRVNVSGSNCFGDIASLGTLIKVQYIQANCARIEGTQDKINQLLANLKENGKKNSAVTIYTQDFPSGVKYTFDGNGNWSLV